MTEKTAFKTVTVFFSLFTLYAVFLIATMIVKGPLSNLANPISAANAESMTAKADDVASRIAPVGQTKMKSDEPASATPAVATASAAPAAASAGKSGEEVYNSVCSGCHGTGVLGAPKKGNKDDWAPRIAKGIDALVTSATNGKGAMPPKGGNPSLTSAELKTTIEFMQN